MGGGREGMVQSGDSEAVKTDGSDLEAQTCMGEIKTADLGKGKVEGKGKTSRKKYRTQALKGLALLIRSVLW